MSTPTVEQRLQTMTSNLEQAIKASPADAPNLMILHQLKELAGIVDQMRRERS